MKDLTQGGITKALVKWVRCIGSDALIPKNGAA